MHSLRYCLVIVAILLVFSLQTECRKRNHKKYRKPITFGTLSDKMQDDAYEGQKFMRHQIQPKHKDKGWRHGRMGSSDSSGSNSDSLEGEPRKKSQGGNSKANAIKPDKKSFKAAEKHFRELVKSHGCEDSEVYRKFLTYYRKATSLKKNNVTEISWLTNSAPQDGVCPPKSCDTGPANAPKNTPKKEQQPPSAPKLAAEATPVAAPPADAPNTQADVSEGPAPDLAAAGSGGEAPNPAVETPT